MTQISGAIIALAYLLGLLMTGIPGTVRGIPLGSILFLFAGVGAGFIIPRFRRPAPKLKVWLIAAIVGFAAGLYFDWRMPEATDTDVSRYGSLDTPVIVTGEIISTPRLTRSDKVQFELEVSDLMPAPQKQHNGSDRGKAEQSSSGKGLARAAQPLLKLDRRPVTGKIYVTVPNDRKTPFYPDRIYPGQTIAVTGALYLPRTAGNPGGFDFRQYLRRSGIFTGLRGESVKITGNASPPLFWSIRRRIVLTQAAAAGERTGALLSAIVVGRRGVDVPFDIQDAFCRVGLAHVLAASGFQVTLLIGVILSLTARLKPWTRFAIGLSAITFYVGLTGAEAPALRAGIMGSMVLLAMTIDRRVKILPVLLLTATVMLVFDPLAIWDLGFQMSFLATLGLIVTVPWDFAIYSTNLQFALPICNSLHQFL